MVEIGFGSGLNIPFYPAPVDRVSAVEPADVGWRLARKRLDATSIPVQRSGLDGHRRGWSAAATSPGPSPTC